MPKGSYRLYRYVLQTVTGYTGYRLYRLPVIPVTGYTGWENSACPRQTLYETVKLTVTADCMVMEPAYLTVA